MIKKSVIRFNKFYKYASITHLIRKKIKKLIKLFGPKGLNSLEKKKINNFFSQFGFNNIKKDWHRFYTHINGKFETTYIPEDIYYAKIEPVFNRHNMFPALLDKNLFSNLFAGVKQPKTIIKNSNGFYYIKTGKLVTQSEALEICLLHRLFVIKPTIDSGAGKNITLYEVDPKDNKSILNLFKKYKKDFIVQEVVSQNEQMSLLNPSSLNTLRVFSYLRGTEVIILSVYVRVGAKNEFTDNVSKGGISCGVNNDGELKKYGYDSQYNKFDRTDFGCEFQNFKIPYYSDILNTAKHLHKQAANFKLIAWDLALDNTNSVVFIEYNISFPEINQHQIHNGPLFGDYTNEILEQINT